MDNLIDDVLRNIDKSKDSDRQLSNIWLFVYFAPIISSIVTIGFAIISVLSVVSTSYPFISLNEYNDLEIFSESAYILILFLISILIFFVVNLLLTYELIKRRNLHFARQNLLFNNLILDLDSLVENKSIKEETNFPNDNKILNELNVKENRKDPILWAVLSAFLPIISWYVNYFLMKDFYNHERREEIFWANLVSMLKSFDINFAVPPRTEIISKRSFELYLILTIITCGLFGIFWIHILLRDPNEHFKYHIKIENVLKSSINSI
ncbi:MAG: hypothetical protein P8Y18_07030 [Candidatus Bathyarchaeota archaeon]